VGIEPGIKPAVNASASKRIGVLATSATIASDRYRLLLEAHAKEAHVVSLACPGLVELIELADAHNPALQTMIDGFCSTLRAQDVDTVLLGCTHYPLVQAQFQASLGAGIQVLNIEEAVATQARKLWLQLAPDISPDRPSIRLETTGQPEALQALTHSALCWHVRARHITL